MEYYKFLRQHVGHEPIMLAGSGVIIYKENKVLLQKRADDKCWGYHGGIVEIGESTEEAVRRELIEEIGVKVGKLRLFNVYSGKDQWVHYDNGDIVNYVDIVYITDELIGTPQPDNAEALDCEWFDIDDLPDNIHSTNKKALSDFAAWYKSTHKN